MQKQIIATLVGGILLFLWQFLSWGVLPVHKAEYGYTPNHEKIMEVLNQNLSEEGTYMLPGMDPSSTPEQMEANMKANEGKPWASVSYHKSMNTAMGMNMFRGFVVDLLAAWLLVWLLLKSGDTSMASALKTSLAVGVIGYLTIPYLNSVWFESDSIGHLVDALVSWGLVGAWLSWWLSRK